MNVPELKTSRLLLRPIRLEDADAIQPLFAQWEVVRYLNARIPWPFPANGVHTFYRDIALPGIERGEEWHWTIRLLDRPDSPIGAISLHPNKDANRGFWIAAQYRNQRFASEAAAEVTRFWFEDLKQPILRVKKAIENTASRSISVHQGMTRIAIIDDDYVCGRLPTEVWEIDHSTWQVHNKSRT
ncbi:MAG: GNAT family N-acetyltransferase [Edaphobacter sp.]|uniref:GNAT family N-acetyltransferase n=1 Tax=Edaphobacter sp. TaxID=1934404 RepID=UPI0023A0B450|nr:GNAT family N-acetyltransferase [Edaphobacter sp.]MDE1175787.1 GNAT family N-acetyltransferase [Edaphobacter sp.]